MFTWHPGNDLSNETIGEVLSTMVQPDQQEDIPEEVRMVENPEHWFYRMLEIPGGSTLARHDPLHVLLEQGTHINAEAFVLGLSMGADEKAQQWHFSFYIWWVTHKTPQPFVFTQEAVDAYWLGVKTAEEMGLKNIHLVPLEEMHNQKINEVRKQMGINMEYLRHLYAQHKVLQTK
ncbi:MAG TPA: hypothetical protein VGE59_01105 [Patescibacteria group bacterium]